MHSAHELVTRFCHKGGRPAPLLTSAAGASRFVVVVTDCDTPWPAEPGAVAAPTAGLHLTEELLARLAAHGNPCVKLTLHVGLGTFRPIQAASLAGHEMHAEWARLTPDAAGGTAARHGSTAYPAAAARDSGAGTERCRARACGTTRGGAAANDAQCPRTDGADVERARGL